MPMMLSMIWMARICKAAEFVLNWHAIPETDEEDVSEAVVTAVAAGMEVADPVATHLDHEPITDWLLRTCLLVHLGRYVFLRFSSLVSKI